jgi:hypothetical protein
MKIGHYMHIPPRDVFFSQIFGSFLGIPINYAVVKWVLETKADYLTGKEVDPTHQWTGQELASNLTMAVQYVMIVSSVAPSTMPRNVSPLLTSLPGPPPPIRTTHLPLPPTRLRARCHRPNPDLHAPPPLPARQIPVVEHDHLLQRDVAILWKHQFRLLEQSDRRLRGHVLGLPLPLRSVGAVELYFGGGFRRRLQLQHAAHLLVLRSGQDRAHAELVG